MTIVSGMVLSLCLSDVIYVLIRSRDRGAWWKCYDLNLTSYGFHKCWKRHITDRQTERVIDRQTKGQRNRKVLQTCREMDR